MNLARMSWTQKSRKALRKIVAGNRSRSGVIGVSTPPPRLALYAANRRLILVQDLNLEAVGVAGDDFVEDGVDEEAQNQA